MKEGIFLKTKDQLTAEVVYKVSSGQMRREDALRLLQVSSRTLERYLRAFKSEGITFVMHGNRKRPPINRTSPDIKKQVMDLVREKYFDFNMLHCLEMIERETGLKIKRETFRTWAHEAGMVKRSKRRRSHPRYKRERMPQAGMMVLMDGSHHKWFGEVDCCLNATIDDATGEVLHAEFTEGETTWACLKVLRKVVEKKGIFRVLYVDRAGVYGGTKRVGFTQVQRALAELGTQVIFAHSPQAKGRIERLFLTVQDRLIPEMRLNGITTFSEANKYLQEVFIPHYYNARLRVKAINPHPAYLPLHPSVDLNSIFIVKDYRSVGRDHTISLDGDRYMIDEKLKYSIHNQQVEIRRYENGSWEAYFAGRSLRTVLVRRIKKIS